MVLVSSNTFVGVTGVSYRYSIADVQNIGKMGQHNATFFARMSLRRA